jgi:fatty-acyl-CoA synthase
MSDNKNSMNDPLIRTLADVEAFEQVPLERRVDAWTIPEVVARGAALDPEAIALYYLQDASPDEVPTTFTFRQFMAKARQSANLLRRLFGGRDGVAGVLLPLVPENYFLLVGGPSAGILSPVNWAMKPAQIAATLNAAEAEVLVTLGPTPGFDIWETSVEVLKLVPGIRHVIQVRGPNGAVDADKDFSALIARERDDSFDFERDLRPEDTAIYCATGGTTGLPKLAKLSHRGIAYKCHAYHWVLGHGPGQVWIGGNPLFHSGGIVNRTCSPLAHGVSIVIVSPHGFRAPNSRRYHWKLLEKYRVTEISAPPTMLAALIDQPTEGADLSRLQKFANTGSAGLPVATAQAFEKKFGVSIRPNYGLTENTASAALSPRWGEPRYGASGIRIPYTRIKTVIVDRDGAFLRDGAPGESGVIAVKGPGVISGYLDPSLDRNLFFPDGWLNTGDLGRVDEDGYIWVTGRIKDLIIRGGNNIDPSVIDETLLQHPAVELAAAVGRPDAYAGEMPVAYVQLRAGAKATAEEIREFTRERIPERGAAPADIYIIDKMPLTEVSKILKPPLRCDAAERALKAALGPLSKRGVSASVEVKTDPARGTRARITLASSSGGRDAALEAEARSVLDSYTVAYDLTWCD